MLNINIFRRCRKQTVKHVWAQIIKHCEDMEVPIEEIGYYNNVSKRILESWEDGKGELDFQTLLGVARALDKKVVISLEKLKLEDYIE